MSREAYIRKYGLPGHLTNYEITQRLEMLRREWHRRNPGKGFYDGERVRSEIAGTAPPLDVHFREQWMLLGMFDRETGELDTESPIAIYDLEQHATEVRQLMVRMGGRYTKVAPGKVRPGR